MCFPHFDDDFAALSTMTPGPLSWLPVLDAASSWHCLEHFPWMQHFIFNVNGHLFTGFLSFVRASKTSSPLDDVPGISWPERAFCFCLEVPASS